MVEHFESLIKWRPIKGLVTASPTNSPPDGTEEKTARARDGSQSPGVFAERGKALKTGALREGFLQLAEAVRKSVTGLPTLS